MWHQGIGDMIFNLITRFGNTILRPNEHWVFRGGDVIGCRLALICHMWWNILYLFHSLTSKFTKRFMSNQCWTGRYVWNQTGFSFSDRFLFTNQFQIIFLPSTIDNISIVISIRFMVVLTYSARWKPVVVVMLLDDLSVGWLSITSRQIYESEETRRIINL